LAGGSAALTFVILASFATIVGALTNRQVRSEFDVQLGQTVNRLISKDLSHSRLRIRGETANCQGLGLGEFASADHAQIRIFDSDGTLLCTQSDIRASGRKSKPIRTSTFNALPSILRGRYDQDGYRVVVRDQIKAKPTDSELTLLYAQPLSDIDQTLARVQAFLLLGVLGGAVLALLAGLFVSDRAMSPIKELTRAAREIGRTEDTTRRVPHPEAEDEIAELARTLDGMLGALDASRTRTQRLLDRQREFVADASHELRTPLNSVLANLEILTEELDGQPAETADAALRSTRRMRRLVGDLLLLARADAARSEPHRPTDLAEVLVEAAAELGPMAEHHELSIDAQPAVVLGARDELHRLILNLLENAIRHTPPGTRIAAATRSRDGDATIVVQDSGPGISPELRQRVFERFVRGGGDGGRGSGLGLAIVRSVAESHGGEVTLTTSSPAGREGPGTRFLIRLPAVREPNGSLAGSPGQIAIGDGERDEGGGDQTSTTTGRTIGRRRSRS
jgi:two-component system OmpR family sensor kinase